MKNENLKKDIASNFVGYILSTYLGLILLLLGIFWDSTNDLTSTIKTKNSFAQTLSKYKLSSDTFVSTCRYVINDGQQVTADVILKPKYAKWMTSKNSKDTLLKEISIREKVLYFLKHKIDNSFFTLDNSNEIRDFYFDLREGLANERIIYHIISENEIGKEAYAYSTNNTDPGIITPYFSSYITAAINSGVIYDNLLIDLDNNLSKYFKNQIQKKSDELNTLKSNINVKIIKLTLTVISLIVLAILGLRFNLFKILRTAYKNVE